MSQEGNSDDDTCCFGDIGSDPLPPNRTAFGSLVTVVYGWPSTGGLWVHDRCSGVELAFLSVSPSTITPSQRDLDPKAEDEFCERLERIGARFYRTELAFRERWLDSDKPAPVWFGWPEKGGVLSLRIGDEGEAQMGVGRVKNALSMRERCVIMESMGAEWYKTWEDAPKPEMIEQRQP